MTEDSAVFRNVDPVDLQCGHSAVFNPLPRLGDLLYCYRCTDWFMVKGDALNVAVIKKNHIRMVICRECLFRRKLTHYLSTAHLLAETHALKKSHTVDIMDADEIIETVTVALPSCL